MDEVFVKINGEAHYLWRAVDYEGEVPEDFAAKRRDLRAVIQFIEGRYNPGRRHSVLGYESSVNYERIAREQLESVSP